MAVHSNWNPLQGFVNCSEVKSASSGRMEFVDVAKGFAMICIVLGHMGISWINRFVFTFHVPVFFLVSGYFIFAEEKLSSFIVKKLRTLIVPYFLTCGVIVALGFLKGLYQSGIGLALQDAKYWFYASIYGAGDSVSGTVFYCSHWSNLVSLGIVLGKHLPETFFEDEGCLPASLCHHPLSAWILHAELVLVSVKHPGRVLCHPLGLYRISVPTIQRESGETAAGVQIYRPAV